MVNDGEAGAIAQGLVQFIATNEQGIDLDKSGKELVRTKSKIFSSSVSQGLDGIQVGWSLEYLKALIQGDQVQL